MTADDIREAARQAAREAVAALTAVPSSPFDKGVRAGERDDDAPAVKYALLGADAALAAVAPLIRAQCAEVARDASDDAPRGSYDNGGTQDGWQMACREIDGRILALNEKEAP